VAAEGTFEGVAEGAGKGTGEAGSLEGVSIWSGWKGVGEDAGCTWEVTVGPAIGGGAIKPGPQAEVQAERIPAIARRTKGLRFDIGDVRIG
jgi:hypothetical protein